MAADQAAVRVATGTLTAATDFVFELTRPNVLQVEIVNQGTDVVYFAAAATEADLPALTGGGADEEQPLLGGERLVVNVPGPGTWVVCQSSGTPTVSVVALN